MPALDIFYSGVQALWSALEADADWSNAVPPKNRIKYVIGESSTVRRLQGTTSDFPKAVILTGNFTDDMFVGHETFSIWSDDFDPQTSEWFETITIEHSIILQSRTIRYGEADPLGFLTLRALRKFGPTLRTDNLQMGKVSGLMKEGDRNIEAGTIRWDFLLKVPIMLQLEGRDLTS